MSVDTDNDGSNDNLELLRGTNSSVVDSDADGLGDGYSDGTEIHDHRTWPLDPESHP